MPHGEACEILTRMNFLEGFERGKVPKGHLDKYGSFSSGYEFLLLVLFLDNVHWFFSSLSSLR